MARAADAQARAQAYEVKAEAARRGERRAREGAEARADREKARKEEEEERARPAEEKRRLKLPGTLIWVMFAGMQGHIGTLQNILRMDRFNRQETCGRIAEREGKKWAGSDDDYGGINEYL
ncbi:hypothetical protein BDZ45DRAFT_735659 [Acephala macrosclerotiorum]|nr:hypothetical protein BDZ45DRAFT_735659 [Acephala macrosclerotiorum]